MRNGLNNRHDTLNVVYPVKAKLCIRVYLFASVSTWGLDYDTVTITTVAD